MDETETMIAATANNLKRIIVIIATNMPTRTTHIPPAQLGLPPKIGTLQIPSISWEDFPRDPPDDSPYLAHIYWTIHYHYPPPLTPPLKQTVSTEVSVMGKSWWRQVDNPGLLKHEYGHLLIGCLCALEFEKRINWELKKDPSLGMGPWCRAILSECLK